MSKVWIGLILGEGLICLGVGLLWGWPPALMAVGVAVAFDAVWTARDQHYQAAKARYEQDRGEQNEAFLNAQAQLRRRL